MELKCTEFCCMYNTTKSSRKHNHHHHRSLYNHFSIICNCCDCFKDFTEEGICYVWQEFYIVKSNALCVQLQL